MSKGEVDPSPNTPPGLKTGMSDLDNLMNEPAVRDALDSMYSGLSGIDAVEAVIAELDEELSVEPRGVQCSVLGRTRGWGYRLCGCSPKDLWGQYAPGRSKNALVREMGSRVFRECERCNGPSRQDYCGLVLAGR